MQINLATNLQKRIHKILSKKFEMSKQKIDLVLSDDDSFAEWLDFNWSKIATLDMLEVRDILTWSYLMDTSASIPVELNFKFDY